MHGSKFNQAISPDANLEGTITEIVSHEPDTGYTVLEVLRSSTNVDLETVITHFHTPYTGTKMRFNGKWHTINCHDIFYADYVFQEAYPTGTNDIKQICSEIFSGIDTKIIESIVNNFKDKTFDVLDSPEAITQLNGVSGVSKEQTSAIMESWTRYSKSQSILYKLQSYGLKYTHAFQAYGRGYGEGVLGEIEKNPYRLVEDLGLSFLDIDPVALNMKFRSNDPIRISTAITHILKLCQDIGHCYLTKSQIHKRINALLQLNLSEKEIAEKLNSMIKHHLVKTRKLPTKRRGIRTWYYEPSIFEVEEYIAQKLSQNVPPKVNLEQIKNLLKTYRASEPNLNDDLAEVAVGIATSKYSILTGAKGTGKVLITKAILAVLNKMKVSYSLVSSTNQSARLMAENVGENVQTINELLIWQERGFLHNENNLLKCDFLIVDELSLFDIRQTSALLKAITDQTQVLFLGDTNLLPVMGPGNILKDIIESKSIPVYQLTNPLPQVSDSMIVRYANQIKLNYPTKMILSDIETEKFSDSACDCFFFFSELSPYSTVWENIIEDFEKKCPYAIDNYRLDKLYDWSMNKHNRIESIMELVVDLYQILSSSQDSPEVQILAPTIQCSDNIMSLKDEFSSTSNELILWNKELREKEPVIQCKDNYRLGVFNGEIGTIKKINNNNFTCDIEYSRGRQIHYGYNDLMEIKVSHSISVQQSIGCEFDVVIIPLFNQQSITTRDLIYTAMTRAKQLVIFVGDMGGFHKAIKNRYQIPKQTGLKELFKETVN